MAIETTSETLGARVKRLREKILIEWNGEKKPMTQKQLADKAGCDECTISRIERDVLVPSFPLAITLALALGVSTDMLAGLKDA